MNYSLGIFVIILGKLALDDFLYQEVYIKDLLWLLLASLNVSYFHYKPFRIFTYSNYVIFFGLFISYFFIKKQWLSWADLLIFFNCFYVLFFINYFNYSLLIYQFLWSWSVNSAGCLLLYKKFLYNQGYFPCIVTIFLNFLLFLSIIYI